MHPRGIALQFLFVSYWLLPLLLLGSVAPLHLLNWVLQRTGVDHIIRRPTVHTLLVEEILVFNAKVATTLNPVASAVESVASAIFTLILTRSDVSTTFLGVESVQLHEVWWSLALLIFESCDLISYLFESSELLAEVSSLLVVLTSSICLVLTHHFFITVVEHVWLTSLAHPLTPSH